jgi:hypothetical protein
LVLSRASRAVAPRARWYRLYAVRPVPGSSASLGGYFVHTQDVVRANGLDQEEPSNELKDELWLRVQVAARQLYRRRTLGLILETTDGRSAHITGGAPRTVVTGRPSEFMCWTYGREGVADVTLRH